MQCLCVVLMCIGVGGECAVLMYGVLVCIGVGW